MLNRAANGRGGLSAMLVLPTAEALVASSYVMSLLRRGWREREGDSDCRAFSLRRKVLCGPTHLPAPEHPLEFDPSHSSSF